MKVKYRKAIIVFIVSICLSSCFPCITLLFEKDETYWTDVYNKNDKIVFASNYDNGLTKHYDTITILNKTRNIPDGNCNEATRYDSESYLIDYSFKHDTIISESDYLVQHAKQEKGASIPVLRVYGLEYSKDFLKDTTIVLNTTKMEIKDCYSFHKKDCYNGWSLFKIKTFVWSKKLGLVMFIGENGEKFEYLKKITKGNQ
jgi:hypothetical protein